MSARPNENTNGVLREYFPKGTDLSVHSIHEITSVAAVLNAREKRWDGNFAGALDEWPS